jgi:hypothetical protein
MDTNEYVIKTKVCRSLSKQFGLEEVIIDETKLTKSPKQHGLENADVIIPSYYEIHKYPSKIFNLDYYEIIKDDIRNYRELNKYQMEYIKEIKDVYKYELIELYNKCIKSINEIIK